MYTFCCWIWRKNENTFFVLKKIINTMENKMWLFCCLNRNIATEKSGLVMINCFSDFGNFITLFLLFFLSETAASIIMKFFYFRKQNKLILKMFGIWQNNIKKISILKTDILRVVHKPRHGLGEEGVMDFLWQFWTFVLKNITKLSKIASFMDDSYEKCSTKMENQIQNLKPKK